MGKFQLNKKGEDPLKIYEDVFKIANDTVETHLGKLGKQPKPISREFGGFDPAGLNDEGEWYDNPSWEAGYTMSTDELRQHNVNTLKDRFNAQKQGGYRFSYDDEIDSVRNIGSGNGGWSLPQSVMKTPEGEDALRSAKDEVISWIKDQQRAEKATYPDPSWESRASEMEYFPSGNFWDIDSSYGVKTKDELVKERMFIQHFIDSARNDGFNDGRIETYQLKQDDVERQIASYGGQQLGQRDQDGDLFPYFDVDGTPDKTWDLWGKSQSRNRSDHNESRASERLSQCPSCKGVGCIVCDQSGFVSREDYDKIKKVFESRASEWESVEAIANEGNTNHDSDGKFATGNTLVYTQGKGKLTSTVKDGDSDVLKQWIKDQEDNPEQADQIRAVKKLLEDRGE